MAAAIAAGAVVLTTGTFLNGLIHIGEREDPRRPRRRGAGARLSERLYALGLRMGRLKTGTPAAARRPQHRLGGLEVQPGDDPPVPFSFLTTRSPTRRSTAASPHHAGRTPSSAPTCTARRCTPARSAASARATARRSRTRSCASPTASAHQIFLEPEGLDDDTVYPNGISTSLPDDVQEAFLRTIPGLEDVECAPGRLRHRVRLRRPARADARRWRRSGSRACSSPGRSTARPATRRPPRRGSSAGINAALAAGGRRARVRRLARRRLPRRDDRRPRHARRLRALPHVHLARRVPPEAARRQRRPAADAARGRRWAASAASARRSSPRSRARSPRPPAARDA